VPGLIVLAGGTVVERVSDISRLQSLLRSIGLMHPQCTDAIIGSIKTLISVQSKKIDLGAIGAEARIPDAPIPPMRK
jgi:hypothetical protein